MPSTPASTEDILAATQSGRQIVLDVLPPEHFEARHIPGARNACVYEVTFLDQVAALAPDKTAPIIVYGAGEGSLDAVTAAGKLHRAGYVNVAVLHGGLPAWKAEGKPLEGTKTDEWEPAHPVLELRKARYMAVPAESTLIWTGRNAGGRHTGTLAIREGTLIRDVVKSQGLHEGVFSLLFDDGYGVGVALVRHPKIRAVGFTGSRRGGVALMAEAAQRAEPIPVYAEMGSINPVFVLPGALRERGEEIAKGMQFSVTLGVGQFCTNPGLSIVEAGPEATAFVAKLGELIAASEPAVMLNHGICSAYESGTSRFSGTEGVTRVAGVDVERGGGAIAGAALFSTSAATFLENDSLMDEVFGPSTIVVQADAEAQLLEIARSLEGQLTATVHGTDEDLEAHRELVAILETKVGRVVFNSFPTGVEVCHAMVHGGPFPATSDGRTTSVGTRAIERFARPVAWQDAPEGLLPDELKEANPLGIQRVVDGKRA